MMPAEDLGALVEAAQRGSFEALRDAARQVLFQAFEDAIEGTLIVDHEARIVWISERYARRFGLDDPRQALGRPCEDVIPNSRMREVVDSGQPMLLDLLEGSGKPLVVVRLPLRNADGRLIGAAGFALLDEWASLSPLVSRFLALQAELAAAREGQPPARQARYGFSNFVGRSAQVVELKRMARRAAATHSPVLLLGETGTGKELLAHAIHAASPRAHKPFVTLNVAAIPETLLEAELFGVAAGAYTGAERRDRQGKLHIAQGGTLFLDEIGDMPLPLQAKLLRVLQEKEFESLGSNQVQQADVRIIAATSRRLPELVREGRFRADLYYRLDVLSMAVPPLRQRLEDLEPICEALLEGFAESRPGKAYELTPDALELLARHHWPGNIRELRNVLERAVVLGDSTVLTAAQLRTALAPTAPAAALAPAPQPAAAPPGTDHAAAMGHYERQLIEQALAECDSVSAAARRLGIGRATLYRKMAVYAIGTRARRRPPVSGGGSPTDVRK